MRVFMSPCPCPWLFACALAVSLWSPRPAEACSCQRYPDETAEQIRHQIEDAFDRAVAVFTGGISDDAPGQGLRVDRVWKGDIGPYVRLRQSTPSPDGRTLIVDSCDVMFARGKKYLVFAAVDSDSPGVWHASACGFTDSLENAAETLRVLDVMTAVRRGGEPDAFARFLALEQAWMDALSTHDKAALESFHAPDFTFVWVERATAVTGRLEWLRRAAEFPWPPQTVRLLKVHDKGDWAVVHSVLRGAFPPNVVTLEGGDLFFRASDVWVRRGKAWQVLSRQLALVDTW